MASIRYPTAACSYQHRGPHNYSRDGYLRAALLALLSPLLLHASTILDYTPESLWTYDLARWMNVPAVAIAMIAAIVGTHRLEVTTPMATLAALSIALTGTSLALHFHMGGAAEWILLTTLMVTGWLLANLARDSSPAEVTNQLALAILLISTLLAVRGLAAWLPHCLYDGTCNEFYGNYLAIGNRRGFNHIQTAIIPFLIWLTATRSPGHVRTFAFLNTTIMLWMIATTGARGTTVALISTGIIVAWRYRWTGSQWRVVACSVAFSIVAVIITATAQHLTGPEEESATDRFSIDLSSSGRVDLWRDAIANTLDAPILGLGPGAIAALPTKLAHAHNIFLEASHDYGIPVAIFTAVFVLLTLFIALFRLPQHAQPVAWATCALLVHSLVSGVYFYPFGQILTLLMLSLTWGWASSPFPTSMRAVMNMTPIARIIVGTITFFLLIGMSVTFALSFPDYGSALGFVPRLWLSGRYSLPE